MSSCHNVWYGKTRVVGLPDGKKVLRIRSAVLTEKNTGVLDRRTEGQTDRHTDRGTDILRRHSPCDAYALRGKNAAKLYYTVNVHLNFISASSLPTPQHQSVSSARKQIGNSVSPT